MTKVNYGRTVKMIVGSFSLLLILSVAPFYLPAHDVLAQIFLGIHSGSNSSNLSGREGVTPSIIGNASQIEYLSWYNNGTLLLNTGNYTAALVAFDKAISIDPNHAAAWHNRGQTLDKLGKYDEALSSYDKAISLDPTIALTWNNKGTVLYELGRYNEALASYDKAISLDPNNTNYQQNKEITTKQLSTPNISSNNQAAQSPSANVSAPVGGNMTAPTAKNMTYSTPFVGPNVTASTNFLAKNRTYSAPSTLPRTTSTFQNNNSRTYENLTDGFRIQYPYNWTAIPEDSPQSLGGINDIELQPNFSQQDSKPDFSVFVYDRDGRTNDELVKNALHSDKKYSDKFRLVSSTPITVNNNTAYMFSYTYKDPVYNKAQSLEVLVMTGSHVYDIEYDADISDYSLFLPAVQNMIDSFQLLGQNR